MPIPLGILAVAGAGAAGVASDYELIETVSGNGSFATVSFTGLGSLTQYKHLQIRATVRDNTASTGADNLALQFNSATTGYAFHWLYGNGSSVTSTAQTSASRISIYKGGALNNATANVFSSVIIDILDFSNSSKNTTTRTLNGFNDTSNNFVALCSGLWNNTAAVTSIDLFLNGNFITGSRFSLYGIR